MRSYHMSCQLVLTSNGRTPKADAELQYPITPADGSCQSIRVFTILCFTAVVT